MGGSSENCFRQLFIDQKKTFEGSKMLLSIYLIHQCMSYVVMGNRSNQILVPV